MHDELRRLDEELAAGRLDADAYRRSRDELLAARPSVAPSGEAVAAPPASLPEAAAAAPPAPVTAADPPAPQAPDPFPPPFRWGDDGEAGAADPSPDSTQVVAASLAQPVEIPPERTQVVPGGGRPAPRVNGAGGADPTQIVGRTRVRSVDPRRSAAPGPRRSRPLAPPVPPERTQFVPAAALARAGDRRSVPARRTAPPWTDERSIRRLDAQRRGHETFTRGTGPSAATVAGTAAVVLVVVVVLVLSFVLS